MNKLREEQKAEAVVRLQLMGVMPVVIEDLKNGRIYYSERVNKYMRALLYWVDNKPELVEAVKNFEEENNAFVYHVQITHMDEGGDAISFLFVSKDKDEWPYDREDILNKRALAYVKWLDDEFGYIGIDEAQGGIARTW